MCQDVVYTSHVTHTPTQLSAHICGSCLPLSALTTALHALHDTTAVTEEDLRNQVIALAARKPFGVKSGVCTYFSIYKQSCMHGLSSFVYNMLNTHAIMAQLLCIYYIFTMPFVFLNTHSNCSVGQRV